jgi:DNA-binding transcriptional LysR family regulator
MLSQMDLFDKMTTYVRVVEAGSLSAAAKQLRISAAAVSRQIATLEAELRLTLLRRTTRRMAVTPAGERYYQSCLRVLREVDDAQAVGSDEAPEGFLQVSAPVTFGLARVVPYLHTLMLKHPRFRIDLRLEDRVIDLALEGTDVAIRVGTRPPERTDLIAHLLLTYRRVVVASPEYLKRKGEPATPEALAKHDALTYPAANPADSWDLVSGERRARMRPGVVFRSNALHAIRDLAVKGMGVALLPEWMVMNDVRRRALHVILPDWRSEPVPVNAIHRTKQRGALRLRAFVEHLRQAYAT